MLHYFKVAVILLIPCLGNSKNRQASHFRAEGFSLKTDALFLMGNAINKSAKNYYLSGELYFNNEYSFSVDVESKTETQPGLKTIRKRLGSQLRWYFKQDDCNCSALYAGGYFSFVNMSELSDHAVLQNKAMSYATSFLAGGITSGYQTIISAHFVIDPTVEIGMEFPHETYKTESVRYWDTGKKVFLLVRISLGVGYRF